MSFENLAVSQPILTTLAQSGYVKPTHIQAQAIPIAKANKDVIAQAPTGTGKTLAFVIPALERLLVTQNRGKASILILTPTRELANQITDVVQKYGRSLGVKAVNILGGMPYREQLRKLSRPLDIIIATPGRLMDYMRRGDIKLSHIEMLVLDEADRMLDMGFIDDVAFIAAATPKQRQTLLFTATMDNNLHKLSKNILKSPVIIEIGMRSLMKDKIIQRVHMADDLGHKIRILEHLLENEGIYKGIIFSGTKRNADKLAAELNEDGYTSCALHGDMNQQKRNKTISRFREGKIQFLIATDVAARGIDISDVTHVINFDLPRLPEDYVHRIGRTGRAGKNGMAISLVLFSDYQLLQRIERFTEQAIEQAIIPGLEPQQQHREKPKKTRGGNRGSNKNNALDNNKNKRFNKNKRTGENPSRDRFAKSERHAKSDRFVKLDRREKGEKKEYVDKSVPDNVNRNSRKFATHSTKSSSNNRKDGRKRLQANGSDKSNDYRGNERNNTRGNNEVRFSKNKTTGENRSRSRFAKSDKHERNEKGERRDRNTQRDTRASFEKNGANLEKAGNSRRNTSHSKKKLHIRGNDSNKEFSARSGYDALGKSSDKNKKNVRAGFGKTNKVVQDRGRASKSHFDVKKKTNTSVKKTNSRLNSASKFKNAGKRKTNFR